MKSELIDAFINGELSGESEKFFRKSLQNDAELRDRYFEQLRMHEALKILMEDESEAEDFADGVVAQLRSEGADLDGSPERSFAKSVLTEILEERQIADRLRWPDMVKAGLVAGVAAVFLVLGLQKVSMESTGSATRGAEVGKTEQFVARITGMDGASWSAKTKEEVRDDGWISGRELMLEAGVAEITFNSGARVYLEGPAKLSLEHANRGYLEFGKLTAEVPPRASGFVINTPRLNILDIGTRFGVSVLNNGDTEVHVMQGVIEASRTSGNSVPIRITEGLAVRADERTRSELVPIDYAGDEFTLTIPEESRLSESGYIHYAFDESGGPEIEDRGQGIYRGPFDASLTARTDGGNADFPTPKRSAGQEGGGLVFQSGERLIARLPTEIMLDEAFTISFWVKISPRGPHSQTTSMVTLGRPESSKWDITWNGNRDNGVENALKVSFGKGHVIGTTDIRDGQWHHITVRFLGGKDANLATHVHLFVDGELEAISGSVSQVLETIRAGELQMGSYGESGFEGWIDELYLHRSALEAPLVEISDIKPKPDGFLR